MKLGPLTPGLPPAESSSRYVEMEKRRCYAIEIDPCYAEVIIGRWEGFTKKVAEREDGATLEDLKDGKTANRVLGDLKSGKTKLVKA